MAYTLVRFQQKVLGYDSPLEYMKEPDKEWFDGVDKWADKSVITFTDGDMYVITVNKRGNIDE